MEIIAPEFIDNIHKTLSQSLKEEIKPGSKISIAAACFSIYAYQELQNELKNIDELRFIFTSPTFVADKVKKEKREFYIPRLNRERSLYGTEFEVKLRNELNQKAIAKECAEWIKQKGYFKSNSTQQNMPCFMNVDETSYNPVREFTAVELGVEKGNNAAFAITKMQSPMSASFLQMFEQFWQNKDIMQDVTDQVIENITSAYNENAPEFIYFVTLYNIFKEFLDENVDVLYAANTLEAERIIRFYQKERGYTFIEYDEPLVDCPGDINVLEAAGMEFDNVIITLTSHFRYNEDGVLQGNAHPNPDYSYYRLLFQSVSRTRERLCIVVIGDETLFAKVLSIQQY